MSAPEREDALAEAIAAARAEFAEGRRIIAAAEERHGTPWNEIVAETKESAEGVYGALLFLTVIGAAAFLLSIGVFA